MQLLSYMLVVNDPFSLNMIYMEVSHRKVTRSMISNAAVEELGGIHLLVNNAGVADTEEALTATPD